MEQQTSKHQYIKRRGKKKDRKKNEHVWDKTKQDPEKVNKNEDQWYITEVRTKKKKRPTSWKFHNEPNSSIFSGRPKLEREKRKERKNQRGVNKRSVVRSQ